MRCWWCRYWYGRKTFLDEWIDTEFFYVGMWLVKLDIGRRKLFWTKFTGNEKYLVIVKPSNVWTCIYLDCRSSDVWTGNTKEEIIAMLQKRTYKHINGIKE